MRVVILVLLLASGAVAQPIPVAAPAEGGPRHWLVAARGTVNLREGPSAGAAVAARLSGGDILSNLGCQPGEGRTWCYVQPWRGGPVGYVAAELLQPATNPTGGVAVGENDSPLRAGRGAFDATGEVPCAQAAGQPTRACAFGVARAGGGDATLVVTRPDGSMRALFFVRGEFLGADASEAGGGFDAAATREADLFLIRVDAERYDVPDAVVFGG
jgi:hypothetical protein